MDINTFSNLSDLLRIMIHFIIDYASLILLFILWLLAIISIQKLSMIKIKKVYRIVSMFLLLIAILTLPICIIYDLRKNSIYHFHKLFYNSFFKGNLKTFWFGVPAMKNPLDLWIYQEIIFETRPDIIIECGTFRGGSALFFASLCDLLGNGKVLTIDIEDHEGRPQHNRIIYLHGSSTSNEIVGKVNSLIKKNDKVLVCLDSDHHKQHVLNELNLYSKFVSKGSYIFVEDTNINGHPVYREYGEGPMEAVKDFLINNSEFVVDQSREKYLITFNPNGYLKKIK